LSSYLRLLRTEGALSLCLTGFVARMPMAMYSLGTVLMILALHGDYALAGGLSAAGLAGGAVVLTRVAAWVDRYGAVRVLLPQAVAFAGFTAAFIAAAQARTPVWLLFVTGTAAASALPALGAIVRSAWSALCGPGTEQANRAFAFESVTDDVIFMAGPALTAFLVVSLYPAAGIGAAAILAVAGIALLVRQPSIAARRPAAPPAGGAHLLPAPGARRWTLPADGLGVLAPVLMLSSAATASVELATVAYASAHGHRSLAGLILAGAAVGSCAGGLWYGARNWRIPEQYRFAAAVTLSAVGTGLLVLAPSLLAVALTVLATGACITPTLIGGYSILERQARPGRETEAMSWVGFCNCLGGGAGSALSGWAVDYAGPRGGYLTATGCAVLAAVVCVAALPALRPGPLAGSAARLDGRVHSGPQAEVARGQLPVGPRLLQRARPPGQVVQHDVGRGAGDRVLRLAGLVERVPHERDHHAVAQRGCLRLDEDVGQVLDRPHAAGLPAGVADKGDRLVAEAEGDPDGVDRVLQAAGHAAVVLGSDDHERVRALDLGVPRLDEGLGVGRVAAVPDRAEVLGEDRQRPVPQVDDLGLKRRVL
jgi:MFS family permease